MVPIVTVATDTLALGNAAGDPPGMFLAAGGHLDTFDLLTGLSAPVKPAVAVVRGATANPLKTILLAEDNDDLRDVLGLTLSLHGYGVIACRDGQAALEAFHATEAIDLLVTDIEMPRKSGVELARDLDALRPSLPVMIVSGSLIPPSLEEEIHSREWRYLSKPYVPARLLAEIEGLLQPRATRAAPRVLPTLSETRADERGMKAGSSPPDIVATKALEQGGLKVDFSDGTCVFLTRAQIADAAPQRQLQSAAWPEGQHLEYCCYEGCAFCS